MGTEIKEEIITFIDEEIKPTLVTLPKKEEDENSISLKKAEEEDDNSVKKAEEEDDTSLKKAEEEFAIESVNQNTLQENTESVASSQYLASLLSKQKSSVVSFGKLGVSGTLDHSAFQNEFTISANRHKESRKPVSEKYRSFKRCPLIPNGMWAHIPAEWLTIISRIMDVIAEAVRQDNIQFINELQNSEKWFYNELSRYFINNIQGDIKLDTVRNFGSMEKGIRDVVSLGKDILSTHELKAHQHLKNPELLYSSKHVSTNPNFNLLKKPKLESNESMMQNLVDFMDVLSFQHSKLIDDDVRKSSCSLISKTSLVDKAGYVPDTIKSLLNCKSAAENEKTFIKILQSSLVYGVTDEALDSIEISRPKTRTEDEYDDSQYSEFSEKYCEKTNQKTSGIESDNSEIIEEIVDEMVEIVAEVENSKGQEEVVVEDSAVMDMVIKDTDVVTTKFSTLPFPGSAIYQSFISSIMPGYLSDKDLEEKLKIHRTSAESIMSFKHVSKSDLKKHGILHKKTSKPRRHINSIIKEIVAQNRKYMEPESEQAGTVTNSVQTKSILTDDLSISRRKRYPNSLKSRTTESLVSRSSQIRLSKMSDDFYGNRNYQPVDKGSLGHGFDFSEKDELLSLKKINKQTSVTKEKSSIGVKSHKNVKFMSQITGEFNTGIEKKLSDIKPILKERGITESIYRIRKIKSSCKSKRCKDYLDSKTSRKYYREFYNDIISRHQRNIESKSFGRIRDVKSKKRFYENKPNFINKSLYLSTNWRNLKLERSIKLLKSFKVRNTHESTNNGKDKRLRKDLLEELLTKTKRIFEGPSSVANREKTANYPVSPSAYKSPIFARIIYQPSVDKLKGFRVVYLTQEESELKLWLRNIKDHTFHWNQVQKDDLLKVRNSFKLKTKNYENRNKFPCVDKNFDQTNIHVIDDFHYSSKTDDIINSSWDEVNNLVTDFDSNNIFNGKCVSSDLKMETKEQKIKYLIEEKSAKSLSQFDDIGNNFSENVKAEVHQESVKRNMWKYFQAKKTASIVSEITVYNHSIGVLNCGTVSQTDKATRVFTKTESNPGTWISTINLNDSSTLQINETGNVFRGHISTKKKCKSSTKFFQADCCKSIMAIIKKDFFFVMYFLQTICFQSSVIKNDISRVFTSVIDENQSKNVVWEFPENKLQTPKSSLNLTIEYSSSLQKNEERTNQNVTGWYSFKDSYAPMTLINQSDFPKDSLDKAQLKSKFNKDELLNDMWKCKRKFKSTLFKDEDEVRHKTNGTLFNRIAKSYLESQIQNKKTVLLEDFIHIPNETLAIEVIFSLNNITREIMMSLKQENEATCQEHICVVILNNDNDAFESTSKYTTDEKTLIEDYDEKRHLFEIKTSSFLFNDHQCLLQNDLLALEENNALLSVDVGTTKTFCADITLSNLSEGGISKTDESKTLNFFSPFSKVKHKYITHFKTYFESLLANMGISIETERQEKENIQQTTSFLKFHNFDSENIVSLENSKFEIPEIFHLNYLLFFIQNQTDFNWKSILDSFYAEIDFERKTNVENFDGNINELLEMSSDEISITTLEELKFASVDLGNEIFKNYTIKPLLKDMFFELAKNCSLKSFSTKRNVFFFEKDMINQKQEDGEEITHSKLGKLFQNELRNYPIRIDTIIVPVQTKTNLVGLISESGDPVNFQTDKLVMEESNRFIKYIITNVLIDFLKFSFQSSDFAILSPINENLRSVKTISEIIIEILVSKSLSELVGKSDIMCDTFEENTGTISNDLGKNDNDIIHSNQRIISDEFFKFINDCVNKTTNANNDQFDVLSKLFCCREIIKNMEKVKISKLHEKHYDFFESILTDLSKENILEIMAFCSFIEKLQNQSTKRLSTKNYIHRQFVTSKSPRQARYYHLFSKRFFRIFRLKKPFVNSTLNIRSFNHAAQLKLLSKINNYNRKLDFKKYSNEKLTDETFKFELSQIEPDHLRGILDFKRKMIHKSARKKKFKKPHEANKGERKRGSNSTSIDKRNTKLKDTFKKPKHDPDFTVSDTELSDKIKVILINLSLPSTNPNPLGDFNNHSIQKSRSQSDSRLLKRKESDKRKKSF